MKAFQWIAGFFGAITVSSQALCGGLFAPFSMDSASVMPKGVKNFRVGGFTTEVGDKFDGSGSIRPLGDTFNKPVTWGELIDSQPEGFERGQFKGGLLSLGIKMEDVVGESRGVVNSRVTSTLPIFAIGVTEKLTVGVAVPVVYSKVNVDTGWGANPEFQAKIEELTKKGFANKVYSYEADLQNVVATKIASYGYKPLESETRQEVGDVTFAMKYQVFKNSKLAVAVAPSLVVPTGRTRDIDKVVDIPAGDGQFDAGVAAISEYSLEGGRTKLVSSASYTHQFVSYKKMRVPTSADESLTKDLDPSVREKLGDVMGLGLGASFKLSELWSVGAKYGFQYKQADDYSGDGYEAKRYGLLEEDTEQNMHAAVAGVSFTTLPLFVAKKFELPLDASFNISSVFAGRNVNKINLAFVEIAAYF